MQGRARQAGQDKAEHSKAHLVAGTSRADSEEESEVKKIWTQWHKCKRRSDPEIKLLMKWASDEDNNRMRFQSMYFAHNQRLDLGLSFFVLPISFCVYTNSCRPQCLSWAQHWAKHRAGQHRTGQGDTEQGRAKLGKAVQGRAEPRRAKMIRITVFGATIPAN